jgi:hypothetical protein
MTPDIQNRVSRDFSLADREKANSVLVQLCHELGGGELRILRCIVFLSQGELSRLAHYADQARMDARDVIYWAEYDDQDRQIYDFQKPFDSSGT